MSNNRSGSVISFVSQSGDQGKSVLAQALAVYASANSVSATLVDLDIEHRSTQKWGDEREQYGVIPNVNVITCDNLDDGLKHYNNEDLYILDTPSRASDATFHIFANSDLVVFVSTPDEKNLELTLATLDRLGKQGADLSKALICLNRFTLPSTKNAIKNEVKAVREYLKSFVYDGKPIKICKQIIPEKQGYKNAFKLRKTIIETSNNDINKYGLNLIDAIIEEIFDVE